MKDNWQMVVVINWKESKEYKYRCIEKFKYSPDWKGFAFVAKKDWKRIVVKDWIEIDKYDYISYFKYSLDWKNFIFIAQKDNLKWVLVINWIESDEYEDISYFEYLEDWRIIIKATIKKEFII
jgi:hypothetical protein